MFGNISLPELLILVLIAAALIWPATRICAKAGFSPWLGVLIVVPLANVLLLWFLALAEWPSRRSGG